MLSHLQPRMNLYLLKISTIPRYKTDVGQFNYHGGIMNPKDITLGPIGKKVTAAVLSYVAVEFTRNVKKALFDKKGSRFSGRKRTQKNIHNRAQEDEACLGLTSEERAYGHAIAGFIRRYREIESGCKSIWTHKTSLEHLHLEFMDIAPELKGTLSTSVKGMMDCIEESVSAPDGDNRCRVVSEELYAQLRRCVM